jgi:diacylglycerol kinase family enzyme
VIIANGRFYGGRFVCAPEASLDSSEFQACLFGRAGRWHVIRYALALLLGRLPRLKDVTIVPARMVEIAAPAGDPVQGDGDILATLPARIEVAPDRLRLVALR